MNFINFLKKFFLKRFSAPKEIYLEEKKKQSKFVKFLILIIVVSWLIIYLPLSFYSFLFKTFSFQVVLFINETFSYFSLKYENFKIKLQDFLETPIVGYFLFYTTVKDKISFWLVESKRLISNLKYQFDLVFYRLANFKLKLKISSFKINWPSVNSLINIQEKKQSYLPSHLKVKLPSSNEDLFLSFQQTLPKYLVEFSKKESPPQVNFVLSQLVKNNEFKKVREDKKVGGDVQEKIKIEKLIYFPITAKSFLVKTLDGREILAKEPTQKLTLASLTKLMTAVIIVENYLPYEVFEITNDSLKIYDELTFDVGESFDRDSVLKLLLLVSSNKIALAAAGKMGQEKFVNLMNAKAKEIGMNNTFFVEPSGLDPRNVSTAEDYFLLAKYIYFKHPEILNIMKEKKVTVISHQNKVYFLESRLFKFNPLDENLILAGKTGYIINLGYNLLVYINHFQPLVVISFQDINYFESVKNIVPIILENFKD